MGNPFADDLGPDMANCGKPFTQQERQEHSGDKFYEILYDSILPEISRAFSSLKYDWLRVPYDKELFEQFVKDMEEELDKVMDREKEAFHFTEGPQSSSGLF